MHTSLHLCFLFLHFGSQCILIHYLIEQIITKQIITTITMSELLFKVMANSYCRYHEQNHFLQDCLGAIDGRIDSFKKKLSTEIMQIKEVLSEEQQMSVIEEEETDRSFTEEPGMGFEEWMQVMKKKCNRGALAVSRMEEQLDKLVNIYKGELLDMSKQMTKWEQRNQELKKENKKHVQENNQLKNQIEDLKDQMTKQAANFVLYQNSDCSQIFQKPKKQIETKIVVKQKLAEMSIQNPNNEKRRKTSITKIFKDGPQLKQNNSKSENTDVVKYKDNAVEQKSDILKWRKLSKKIDELKSKLVMYEEEIKEKDEEIASLNKKLKSNSVEDEGKRKLKTANTTLRGQKTILNNQINSLKKNYSQKVEICDLQQMEVRQLKAQIENFTTTIKWQAETIEELRASLTKGLSKESEESEESEEWKKKIESLEKLNEKLVRSLLLQERQLEAINEKIIEIEENYEKVSKDYRIKVGELESILDEKNEMIVKLKTSKGSMMGQQSQNAYYNQLVRVLTKKLGEKEEVIRRMAGTH